MKKALLLVGHGSRSEHWGLFFQNLHKTLLSRSSGQNGVFLCFLQFTPPNFSEAFDKIVSDGFDFVFVWPLFLGLGAHVEKDIPEELEKSLKKHPNVSHQILPALGEDADFLKFLSVHADQMCV